MKKIVFLGDSITDCDRDYDDIKSVGKGYVSIMKQKLVTYEVINKGIAGNKIADLYDRLEKDCIDLKPDIVCILIGINDVWHFMDGQDYDVEKEIKRFQKIYEDMVIKIKKSGVEKIILIEPFVLPEPEERKKWRYDLNQRIDMIKNIAKKYQCFFVPIDKEINAVGRNQYTAYCGDGVHPTKKGHEWIAKQFLDIVEQFHIL